MKFRKKPVVIDADQWNPNDQNARELAELQGWKFNIGGSLLIPTLEGTMMCLPGDYIIRGVKGEYYSCKPDIFELTYEKVEE